MAGKVKQRGAAAAPSKVFSLISDVKLKELYATMLKCRALHEQAESYSKSGKTGKKRKSARLPEATIVGTTIDLRRGDWVVPGEGELTAAFVKGLPLDSILGAGSGDATSGALLHSAHNILRPTLSSASRMNIAVGIGLASRGSKDGNVVVIFSRASATSGKHWRDAARLASEHLLPVIFVVYEEDIAGSKGGKKRKKNGPRSAEYGFPVIPVDADDVVAMYRVAHESIQKGRQGRGPTLIEAKAFPVGKSDGDGKFDDGIVKMEKYLTGKGLFAVGWKQKLAGQFQADIHAAIAAPR